MQTQKTWQIGRAKIGEATEILELIRDGMYYYANQSGLSPETAEQQLGALQETLETVQNDIVNGIVFVARSKSGILASLRLKELPPQLSADIINAGLHGEFAHNSSSDTSSLTSVAALASCDPQTYYLLTRFAVSSTARASGIGAALLRKAFDFAVCQEKKGIFLYTAAENSFLLNFYRSFGFQVQSVSNKRAYPRALLFAPCKRETS